MANIFLSQNISSGEQDLLDELLSIALIGTARGGGAPVPSSPALQEAISSITGEATEQRLLTHAALLTAYARAGCKPFAADTPSSTAEPDVLSSCSARAADLLSDLIRDGAKDLVAEWLAAAIKAKRRVPHRLLPNVLELARKEKTFREAAVSVTDRRGRWLIGQNPDWQFAVAETPDESWWETGTPEQRLLVLRQIRRTDAALARELLQQTWKDDPVDQRVEFLKEFAAGLSMADEPLLESMLDDRSKQVRALAADLLGRLPQSQLVQRMTARVSPLLVFKRGLLKGVKLDITLPPDLDKATQHDGIEKSAPQGIGEKQWWLQQMLSFVPPALWTHASGQTPTDLIVLAAKTDYADALLKGWSSAAERNPNPLWLDPLLRYGFEKDGRLSRTLLTALPPKQFLGLVIDVLRNKRIGLVSCSDLINHDNVPLDLAAGRLWVQTVALLATRASREQWAVLYQLPGQCAMRLPSEVREQVESLWSGDGEPWVHRRSNVEKLLKILQIRQQIQKEFMS